MIILLKSKYLVFREGLYFDIFGDWKFNLKGLVVGKVIEFIVVFKNYYDSLMLFLIIVWISWEGKMYYYIESGLLNVYLKNGVIVEVVDGEEYISIDDMNGFYSVIV